MKSFQYSFELNPNVDKTLVDKVQNKLSAISLITYVKELPKENWGENSEHAVKGYVINNNSRDVIEFMRLKNDFSDVYQVAIYRTWRFTPKYFRNILDDLGATRDKGYSFDEIDMPDIKRNLFEVKK